jgi:hypothetical protein
MNKEQFEQIITMARATMFIYKDLRFGQAIFNEFNDNFPNEVAKIRATENDCFIANSKIVSFIDKIFELTNATKECKEYWYASQTYYFLIKKFIQ